MIIGKSDCSGRSFRFYSSSSFLSCKTCLAFDGDTTNARFPLESFAGHVVHTMPRTAFSCTSKKRKKPCKCFIYKAFRSFCYDVLRCVGDFNHPTKCTVYQLVTLAFAVSGHNVVTPFRRSKIDVRKCPSFKELSRFKCNLFSRSIQISVRLFSQIIRNNFIPIIYMLYGTK